MQLDTVKETPVSSTADEIWSMPDNENYTLDIWGHYRQMTDFIDVVNYLRFVLTDEDPTTAKYGQRALTWLGFAMPSLAYTAPSQTTDLSYFEHLVLSNAPSDYLVNKYSYYGSENVSAAQLALDAAFYRLISGRDTYDTREGSDDVLYGKVGFHELVDELKGVVEDNGQSAEGIPAIDTVRGRFEALPNLIAMMAFELHDRFFGTDYASMNADILDFVESNLRDDDTGLFYESYMTGRLGYEEEPLDSRSRWRTSELLPSVNALALVFYNHFNPEQAGRAWASFKERFGEELLGMTADDIATSFGKSFHTALGPSSEALFGALAAAREMDDEEWFGKLQDHLFEIGDVAMTEGQTHYRAFGDYEAYMGMFLTFARTHIPWKTLLENDWEASYSRNDSIMH